MASSRGLPGFLRRTLRVDYDEEEEEDDDNEEEGEEKEADDQEQEGEGEEKETDDDSLEGNMKASAAEPQIMDRSPSKATAIAIAAPVEQQQQQPEFDKSSNSSRSVSSSTMEPSAESSRPADAAESSAALSPSPLSDSWEDLSKPPATATITDIPKSYQEKQFEKVIEADVVSMSDLRKLGWNGIPTVYRARAWKILLGYLPTNQARRQQTLQRKRSEYKDAMAQHYDIDDDIRTLQEQETLRQVIVDVPRTAPDVPLFRNDRIRRILSRLLYIWAMRHPASSYVQGINDLATPLLVVFLGDYYDGQDVLDGHVMNHLSDERLDELEADVYWCLTNLLAGIQDHYTADQPGVQRMVMRLEELVNRIDGDLCRHLRETGIEFLMFSFKWMNCLLLREFQLRCVVRLWDTYISEKDGFEDFHVYVCAAFLCQFSSQLQTMSFDDLFGFMQEMPTADWTDTEIEMLLSQAFVLSTLFGGSDAHLTNNNNIR
jgi:hypothetical protein